MTFDAIVPKDALAATLDSVDVLVDECKVDLGETGIKIRAVDPANVGMVDLSLDAGAFESYEADGGVIGINLGRLQDVVAMADAGDLIHLELDEETRKLHVEVGGLEATLALIDPDSIRARPDIPDLELPATIWLDGGAVDRAVTAADLVSDHIALGASAEFGVFYAEAEGDTDDVDLRLDGDDLIDTEIGDDAHSLFSLDYLKDIKKAIPSDAEVELELGEELPVKMHLDIAAGDGSVTYMLAPRIQNE